ncbi:VanZ family protein [Brevibacillus sp. SYP-B805]|nr:VanZ family protein [Brevibacillus sp. SYP-B805]
MSKSEEERVRTVKIAIDLILVCLLLAGICYASSQPYEKQDIRKPIEQHLGGGLLEQQLDGLSFQYAGKELNMQTVGFAALVEFFIRKGTHFLTFALLALLVYRFLRNLCTPAVAIPWSGLISLFAAVLDEWHQTHTPHRTGMLVDVLLDAAGIFTALLGIVLLAVLFRSSHSPTRWHHRREQRF